MLDELIKYLENFDDIICECEMVWDVIDNIKIFKVWYEDRKLLPGQRMKKKLIARIFWDYNGDSIIKTYDKEYHDKMKEFAEQHNFDYVVRCWEKV